MARRCEGVDYYAAAPAFYSQRARASVFEMFPGVSEYGSRRPIPMGDGGGRRFGGDRDKALSARRILVNYYRADPAHQAVHVFNEVTPRSSVGQNAYKDFLWRDKTVSSGQLGNLGLSHLSAGPGFVYARSGWDDAATHFFFKCGDRFTAHQHLDVGHFTLYKHAELAGDGGHYDEFGTSHDVNYHLRTIAHSTLLIHDPQETWPAIRAGSVTANDGGQHHAWRHHNGATADLADWQSQRQALDIADLLAFEDRGDYLYMVGDCTRAYATNKLERFVRQIVYLRPDTFVIYDQVKSRRPEFKKTWMLQAMRPPEKSGGQLVITHGQGRLFVQTILPGSAEVRLVSGDKLYAVGDRVYPPSKNTGPAPECRIEVSPVTPSIEDHFLHVLTASRVQTASAPMAESRRVGNRLEVRVGSVVVDFDPDKPGGGVTLAGRRQALAQSIRAN